MNAANRVPVRRNADPEPLPSFNQDDVITLAEKKRYRAEFTASFPTLAGILYGQRVAA